MAAITRTTAHPISPPGVLESKAIAAQAKIALVAGDVVSITADAPERTYPFVVDKLPTADSATAKKKFVVIMDAKAGGVVNICDDFDMDGWSGMTAGDPVYASAAVAGGLDAAAVAGSQVGWALTATQIRFHT